VEIEIMLGLTALARWTSSAKKARRSGKRQPRTLQLESLECRALMSVSPLESSLPQLAVQPVQGQAEVAPSWFRSLEKSASRNLPKQSIQQVLDGAKCTTIRNEWLVKLTDTALKQAPDVDAAAKLLSKNRLNVISGLGTPGWLLVRADRASSSANGQARVLQRNQNIACFEPNVVLSGAGVSDRVNDPRADELYGLDKIDASGAWQFSQGDPKVTVAVIDTGVDWTHPDLAANIWTNTREIAGNRKDDDGNGFVDDTRGWDFIDGDNTPSDPHGHGTHVSGTIGAVGNNGTGVVGVNQRVGIMPVRAINSQGYMTWADATRAINYVTLMKSQGVNVAAINASWGGPGSAQSLYDAIRIAGEHDILFVAAAGNDYKDNDSTPSYPANYDLPNVISVAATDQNDQLAGFSNYGAKTVDLAAPGVGILSTLPGNSYAAWNGTSMATPHVVGVAALAVAEATANGQSLSVEKLRDLLLSSVDVLPQLQGRIATGGRLDAASVLRALQPSLPSLTINDVTIEEGQDGVTKIAVFTVNLSKAGSKPVRVQYQTVNGTATTADGDYRATSGKLTWAANDTKSKQIRVRIVGDNKYEPDESFSVLLKNPLNAVVADATGVGTIRNNDPRPTLSIGDVRVTEGDRGFRGAAVTVSLSGTSSEAVTVRCVTTDGSAVAHEDYQPIDTTVTFQPGETQKQISVNLIGDVIVEPDEAFSVVLADANTPVSRDSATVTIANDDAALTGTQLAAYRDGLWCLDLAGNGGLEERSLGFGLPGDVPLAGDWNGDGQDELWVVRYNTARGGLDWLMDLNADGYMQEQVVEFGLPGDTPLAGDWNRDGRDEAAVVRYNPTRGGFDWYFDLNRDGYLAEQVLDFGLPGDTPVAGDWNGDGRDDMGMVRYNPERQGLDWCLDTANNGYLAEEVRHFGLYGDVPVAGDWNNDGREEMGVVRGGTSWWLDVAGDGDYAEKILHYGLPSDRPVAGNWGVYRSTSARTADLLFAATMETPVQKKGAGLSLAASQPASGVIDLLFSR
jgi:subtilisin family serine protease